MGNYLGTVEQDFYTGHIFGSMVQLVNLLQQEICQ